MRRFPVAFLLFAAMDIALRAGLLAHYGPIFWPDSDGYIQTAQAMATIAGWWHSDTGVVTFRSLGYPAFLLGIGHIAPEMQFSIVATLQSLLSLATFWGLFRLGRFLGLTDLLAAGAAFMFSASHLITYDLSILADSLFANLFLISLCLALIPVAEGRRRVWLPVGLGGVLFAGSIAMRDATVYLLPVIALGLFVVSSCRSSGWMRSLAISAVFILPSLVFWQGYLSWNEARTGHRFMTTVGQSVYLLHPLEVEYRGTPVLRDPRLREAFHETESSYAYGHALAINEHLSQKYRLNEYERQELSRQAYWDAWRAAPTAMLRQAMKEIRIKHSLQIVRLGRVFLDYRQLTDGRAWPPVSAVWRGGVDGITYALLVLELLSRVVSGLLFLLCIVGVPVLVSVIRNKVGFSVPQMSILVFAWMVYVAMTAMYAIIHFELRYTLPAQAFVILTGMAGGWGMLRAKAASHRLDHDPLGAGLRR